MKGSALFQGEIITKLRKYIDKIKKSSSQEPLGQFQPNLAQSILGCRGLKFIQMKGPALFQEEIIMKLWKYINEFKKSSFPEPLGQFQPILPQNILGCRGFKFVQMKGSTPFQGEIITKLRKYIDEFKNFLLQNR